MPAVMGRLRGSSIVRIVSRAIPGVAGLILAQALRGTDDDELYLEVFWSSDIAAIE